MTSQLIPGQPPQAETAAQPRGDAIVVRLDDPELEELAPAFLENRGRDVATLRDALAVGDDAVVLRLGHNMKGAGSGFGFDAITEFGAALERGALESDGAAMHAAVEALAHYLARVEVRPVDTDTSAPAAARA